MKIDVSKLLRGVSCPMTTVGIFGLVVDTQHIAVWWGSLLGGIALVGIDIYLATKKEGEAAPE